MIKVINRYFSKLAHYPRLRVVVIIIGAGIAFVVIMNLLRPKDTGPNLPSSVQAAAPQAGAPAQTASNSQAVAYSQLNKQATQQATQDAASTGNTIFQDAFAPNAPTTDNTNSTPNTPTASTAAPAASDSNNPTSFASANASMQGNANPQDAALAQQVQTLQQQLADAQKQTQTQNQTENQQARNQQLTSTMTAMQSGLQNLSSSWSTPTLATVAGTPPSDDNSSGTPQGPVAIKAGTILFGVIDTALDSDEPNTPVLAHIVEGKYKGARLLGGFTTSTPSAGADGALVIQFNTMSLPTVGSSFSINAYAVDAKTGSNSVVTSVNNHYLLRYGMLFASSFLQGFGNAYQSYQYNCPPGTQNCSVVNTNSTGTTNLETTPTTETAMYQGLGQMGQNAAQAAAQEFNTPPTIKVAQGTGIGVLFMSDLRIPYNN
jgi:intracellular multiplication protein IcmE